MEKQFIKRTCDSPLCDTTDLIEHGNENIGQMARWIFIVTSEIVMGPPTPQSKGLPTGQLKQNIKQACRPLCAMNILKTAVEPPKEEGRVNSEELRKIARGEDETANQKAPGITSGEATSEGTSAEERQKGLDNSGEAGSAAPDTPSAGGQ